MGVEKQPASKIAERDALLELVFRYVIAFCGILAFAFNVGFMHSDPVLVRVVALLASMAMMGRVIGATFAEILRAWKGTANVVA